MQKMISGIAVAGFTATMLFCGPGARAAVAATPQPYPAQEQGYPNDSWAVPPSQMQAAEQRGFREGVRGAYKDAQNHRQPNVNNRDEYRDPNVPRRERRAYRDGFQRGYWTGVRHLMGYYNGPNPYAQAQQQQYGPPPQQQQYGPPPQQGNYPNEAWAAPNSEWQAVEQRGFRDGVRGARKDAENHRQPNVENRDEYRHPDDVPGRDRRAYREGFQRGYWAGVQHLMGYYNGANPYSNRR
ncbi:MAG: hypothetical protein WBD10_09240 [Acidobacteriaceae bacterium]